MTHRSLLLQSGNPCAYAAIAGATPNIDRGGTGQSTDQVLETGGAQASGKVRRLFEDRMERQSLDCCVAGRDNPTGLWETPECRMGRQC